MKIRQKSVSFAHQAARQWQGPPLSTAAFVMLGCCTTQLAVGSFSEQLLVHKLWQFSWSLWFGRHAKLHALHSPCVFFEPPRKCGCPIDKAMLDGTCVNCLERGLNCSSMGSEVCSAQALPGFARLDNESRAYKCLTADRCNATQATWLICHVRVVLFLFEERGVWNIRIIASFRL